MDVPAEREGMSAQTPMRIDGTEQTDLNASEISPEAIPAAPVPPKSPAEEVVRVAGTSASQPPSPALNTSTILGVCVVDFVCV